jgi:hypothetical protein
VVDLSTVFCESSAVTVNMKSWSPLAASAEASAPVVEQDEWLKAQRCWLMMCFGAELLLRASKRHLIATSHSDMVTLVHSISQRIAKYLEKVGLVERDMESSFLNLPLDDEVNPDGQLITPARCICQLPHRHGSSTMTKSVYTTNPVGKQ